MSEVTAVTSEMSPARADPEDPQRAGYGSEHHIRWSRHALIPTHVLVFLFFLQSLSN